MDKYHQELFEALEEVAATVIYIEEIKDVPSKDVFETAISHRDELFKQYEKRLSQSKTPEEMIFVKESTFNFLLFSMRKLVAELDDEAIEAVAESVKQKILSVRDIPHAKPSN